ERHAKVFGNGFEVVLGNQAEQPHDQEKRHHGSHVVCVGDFPAAGRRSSDRALAFATDDNTLGSLTGPTAEAHEVPCSDFLALERVSRTCSSSSMNDGRW